jgi:EAL and modified HD-GYP domain-containing signal transduction protein
VNDHPVLGQVALGYSPMFDRQRAITALRLTVFPVNPERAPDACGLLAALSPAWPEAAGRLLLNIVGEPWLDGLLHADLPPHLMLELPAFLASNPSRSDALLALHRRGNTLLIKGLPKGLLLSPLAPVLQPCFGYSIIDLATDLATEACKARHCLPQRPWMLAGVRTLAQADQAFDVGACAVLGWPIDGVTPARASGARNAQPELAAIVELINRVERQESIDRLEAVMRNDPTLAFRLMRYLNSSALGLSVEITSLRHAILMLGYQRLKRWLALLLATGRSDRALKPVAYAAVRRGLLMEELGRDSGCDDDQRAELFICGVFSLLELLMRQPIADLLCSIPASQVVRAALLEGQGPYQPYLALVRAIESASFHDIQAAADHLLMALPAVNRALLRALVAARELD